MFVLQSLKHVKYIIVGSDFLYILNLNETTKCIYDIHDSHDVVGSQELTD